MHLIRRLHCTLAFAACLAAFIIQPGDLGSVDTSRRLQTTHSLWTSAPPVKPSDYPIFGLVGRGGRIYSWYGIGQSVVMLPSDIFITTIIRVMPALGRHESVRELFVGYTVSSLVCVLVVLLCFRFLQLLGFTIAQSAAGAMTLLFATTFLHYTQNMMENNLQLLLTLGGFYFQYEWVKTNSIQSIVLGAIALGANLLIRLTTGLDLMAAMLFIGICLYFENGLDTKTFRRLTRYGATCFPIYTLFFMIDRGYHFYRFNSLFGTYIGIFAQQFRQLHPGVSSTFPFAGPFWKGFVGPILSPDKSIFLFDPMLIITAGIAVCMWRRLLPGVRSFLTSTALLLLIYVIFHARISYEVMHPPYDKGWAGDVAWGDRYITTPVQLLAMMSIPMLLTAWTSLSTIARKLALTITTVSVCIQIASTIFWCTLEYLQEMTLSKPVFIVGLRFMNIVAVALGKTKAWGLTNYLTAGNTHNAIPYFYPIWAAKVGSVPHSAATILVAAWILTILVLIGLLLRICVLCKSINSDMEERSRMLLKSKLRREETKADRKDLSCLLKLPT